MRLGRWLYPPLLLAAAAAVATAGTSLLQQLSRAHFDFTLSLYSALVNTTTADQRHNLLVSPYSVFSLLAMLFLGADSESLSAAQLRSVLRLRNISYAGVQRAFQQAAGVMQHPYYEAVFVAQMGLFLRRDVPLSAFYSRALARFYRRSVDSVDFSSSQVRRRLSGWLHAGPDSDQPQSAVRLPDNPVFLMLSKTHFHGQWLYPFDASMTFDKGLFFYKPSQRLEVPMMTGRLRLPLGYSYDLEARVLELPLHTRRVSIFLLLPDDVEYGLQRLEANLTTDNLRALLSTLKDETVNLKLPRFRLSSSGDLKDALLCQGLRDVFDPDTAHMTGISSEGPVHLSGFLYSTSLIMDESGAPPSAQTTSQQPPPLDTRRHLLRDKYFEVDHPFVFLVWDYHSAMVLLMGRVMHPDPIYY